MSMPVSSKDINYLDTFLGLLKWNATVVLTTCYTSQMRRLNGMDSIYITPDNHKYSMSFLRP
jgi:hypothetical protein